MATPAQILANRANSLKSTGPRSAEGKDASRRNALRHGLAAETLILPEEEGDAVAARILAWGPALAPSDDYQCWLVEEVALASVRVDRCRAREKATRNRLARRAATHWDADRREAAEKLGATLSKSPSLVALRLRATVQGCDWLIARWKGLAAALEDEGEWDEARERLALELIGTPVEFRNLTILLGDDRAALVREQVAGLDARRAEVIEDDEDDRSAAALGLEAVEDGSLKLAHRYETACVRRMEWARKQLLTGQEPGYRPAFVLPPEPPREEEPEEEETPEAPAPPVVRDVPPVPAPEPVRLDNEGRRARRARLARALRRG